MKWASHGDRSILFLSNIDSSGINILFKTKIDWRGQKKSNNLLAVLSILLLLISFLTCFVFVEMGMNQTCDKADTAIDYLNITQLFLWTWIFFVVVNEQNAWQSNSFLIMTNRVTRCIWSAVMGADGVYICQNQRKRVTSSERVTLR